MPPDVRAPRRSASTTRSPALGTALALVLAVHVVAAAVTGSPFSLVALLAPLLGAVLVHRACVLAGTGDWQSCAVVVLALASPLAVVASESAGAGMAVLVVAGAVGVGVGAWSRRWREGRAGALPVVLVLALAPLAVVPVTHLPGALAHGWGTGSTRLATGGRALTAWPGVDPVLPWLALAAAAGLLLVPGRRVLGGAVLAVAAVVVVADLRAAVLVAALPLVALAVVTAATAAWALLRRAATTPRATGGADPDEDAGPEAEPPAGHPRVLVAVAVAVAVAVLAPAWALGVHRLPAAGAATPAGAAARWLAHQVPAGQPIALDAALYEQLADDADPVGELVPLTRGSAPAGAARVRWVVGDAALRAAARPGTWARRALAASRSVAVFGSGHQRLDVRVLTAPVTASPSPTTTPTPDTGTTTGTGTGTTGATASGSPTSAGSATTPTTATRAPSQAALALAANAALDLSAQARAVLTTQPVDDRLVGLLAQIAGSTGLSVVDLPAVAGDDADVPRRRAVIDAIGGRQVGDAPSSVASLRVVLAAQAPQYRPTTDLVGSGGAQHLVITLPPMG